MEKNESLIDLLIFGAFGGFIRGAILGSSILIWSYDFYLICKIFNP